MSCCDNALIMQMLGVRAYLSESTYVKYSLVLQDNIMYFSVADVPVNEAPGTSLGYWQETSFAELILAGFNNGSVFPYTVWVAGTYPLNTWRAHNDLICKVENPAGTSAEPGLTSDSNWLVFENQGAVEKYFADLLS